MKNKKLKGFTLVELILVIGLMAILMVMVGLIMKPISQVFADTTQYTEDRQVMDGMSDYIEDSLKFADRVWIQYDYDSLAVDGAFLESNVPAYMGVPKEKIHVLAIINDNNGIAGFDNDDFTTNDGVVCMGRIYKSAYVDGSRKVWLVGGEAFYGDGSYFVNIEGVDTDSNGHYDSGDLKYTIYSLDPKEYEKVGYLVNLATVADYRDKTREDIQPTNGNSLIANYVEGNVHFVNNPSFGDMTNGGWMSPVDGDLGATDSQGNAGQPVALSIRPGYNIYIYYTVPE